MTPKTQPVIESGVEIDVPLNKLKKSPKNARKVPHSEAAIATLAASIGAKRMLHPLIVEPEHGGDVGAKPLRLVPGLGVRLQLFAECDGPFALVPQRRPSRILLVDAALPVGFLGPGDRELMDGTFAPL